MTQMVLRRVQRPGHNLLLLLQFRILSALIASRVNDPTKHNEVFAEEEQ